MWFMQAQLLLTGGLKVSRGWLTLVALRASVTRSFFSLTSTSLAPPTLITAMPPLSFASRSCSFSLQASLPR